MLCPSPARQGVRMEDAGMRGSVRCVMLCPLSLRAAECTDGGRWDARFGPLAGGAGAELGGPRDDPKTTQKQSQNNPKPAQVGKRPRDPKTNPK